jgi:hypothetical protein
LAQLKGPFEYFSFNVVVHLVVVVVVVDDVDAVVDVEAAVDGPSCCFVFVAVDRKVLLFRGKFFSGKKVFEVFYGRLNVLLLCSSGMAGIVSKSRLEPDQGDQMRL